MSVTMPLLSIKALQLLFPPEQGLLRMTHRYINKGRTRSRLFVRERVELLIELFGRYERTNIGPLDCYIGTLMVFTFFYFRCVAMPFRA